MLTLPEFGAIETRKGSVEMENNTLTVGVCSDTHYWFGGPNFENESLQLQSHSELLLDTLIAELSNAELDIVLHLGDMTSGGGTFICLKRTFIKR